jgi:hypothetical protein
MMPIRGVIRRVAEVIWGEMRHFATKIRNAVLANHGLLQKARGAVKGV